jgi:hypothetical protein
MGSALKTTADLPRPLIVARKQKLGVLHGSDDESNSMVWRNLDRRADICGSLYGDCRS